jgi:hypothetical protein
VTTALRPGTGLRLMSPEKTGHKVPKPTVSSNSFTKAQSARHLAVTWRTPGGHLAKVERQ